MAVKNQGSAPRALILLAMLRKLECEITVAHNGREAVDLFLEGKTFDIVFCDKDMPVMTGPEVLQSQLFISF
jgi:CheY-like chemotaxis protein